jgi:hypothetical protein
VSGTFHLLPTGGSIILAGMQYASNVLLKRRNRQGWLVIGTLNIIGLPYDWLTAQYGYLALTAANFPVAVQAWRAWGRDSAGSVP